jgi:hypothetical protein
MRPTLFEQSEFVGPPGVLLNGSEMGYRDFKAACPPSGGFNENCQDRKESP